MHILDYIGISKAHAQVAAPIRQFVGKVNTLIVNPLIVLMFAAALMYFLYGVFQFIVNADQSEDRETGKQHMLWGIIGMFLMFAVFALLRIIQNTVGGDSVNLNIQ
jgi:succinate dehydrogenase/fumarate reductase cytochrome b subunit